MRCKYDWEIMRCERRGELDFGKEDFVFTEGGCGLWMDGVLMYPRDRW